MSFRLIIENNDAMQLLRILFLFGLAFFALLSLILGAGYLEYQLPGGMPLGNVIAWLGLCAIAGIAVQLSINKTLLGVLCIITFISAILWLPISVLLAGNLELNFSGWRGTLWIRLNLVIISVTVLSFIGALVFALTNHNKDTG